LRPSDPGWLDEKHMKGWKDLTDTERTVAELVGTGLTNRETGRRMYSSPYTVDYHLRQIFRKLGIASRVELARLLGEHREAIVTAGADRGGELAMVAG
jgi:DNA-binding CsgD family transcriptional regulator